MKSIIELAKEVWHEDVSTMDLENLERFAALVRAEREWVDLTEDEVNKLIQAWHKSDDGLFDYANAVIAAFKERNHIPDATKMVAPEGYALISIDALKAWGKYDDVNNACQFSAEPVKQEPLTDVELINANCRYTTPLMDEPVKQGPVAWMDLHKELGQLRWMGGDEGWDNAIHAVRKRLEELYAAPVDAKAIRDALLFLVERCNEQGFYSPIKQPIVQTALAAIREMKEA